jgi:hypothetical protein
MQELIINSTLSDKMLIVVFEHIGSCNDDHCHVLDVTDRLHRATLVDGSD